MFKKLFFLPLLFTLWGASIVVLGLRAWGFDFERALTKPASLIWPASSQLSRDSAKDTLVMAIHPACPCSRASLAELERAAPGMSDAVNLKIVFYEPRNKPPGWDSLGLWGWAGRIPGAMRVRDIDGRELHRFGMTTSGEIKLFSSAGRLLFHGGITESRGHEGDNPGLDQLLMAIREGRPASKSTPVFGCAIFSNAGVPALGGSGAR